MRSIVRKEQCGIFHHRSLIEKQLYKSMAACAKAQDTFNDNSKREIAIVAKARIDTRIEMKYDRWNDILQMDVS
ncbi:MAG: hypothetical protein P8M53_14065 [Pirellulales bacterium]|nr:hypothetical protein [Pirellulales bacterium]